jgi:hypothetical protein
LDNTVKDDYYALPYETWKIYIGKTKIYKDLEKQVREHSRVYATRQFLDRREKVKNQSFGDVNWEAIDKTMQTSALSTRIWITKRVANDCGANAILFQRKQRANDACPFCQQPEYPLHVYKCHNVEVERKWHEELENFKKDLQSANTNPLVIDNLLLGLRAWRKDEQNGSHGLLADQNAIGWNAVLEGCLGISWTTAQEDYIREENIQQNSLKWGILVVRKLWKIAWELWQHRNLKEHNQDKEKETERIRIQIATEIEIGHQHINELYQFFKDTEINKLQGSNQGYQLAWLRNVKARRTWAKRQEGSNEMQSKRRNLRQFLQRGRQ